MDRLPTMTKEEVTLLSPFQHRDSVVTRGFLPLDNQRVLRSVWGFPPKWPSGRDTRAIDGELCVCHTHGRAESPLPEHGAWPRQERSSLSDLAGRDTPGHCQHQEPGRARRRDDGRGNGGAQRRHLHPGDSHASREDGACSDGSCHP